MSNINSLSRVENGKIKSVRQYLSFFVLLAIIIFFSIFAKYFFSLSNFSNMLAQGSILLIAAMGETLVILAGSIDLSVGSLIGLGAVLSAGFSSSLGAFSFVIAVFAGIILGSVSGLLHSKGRIPSFIATLGMLTVARGIVFLYTQGNPILADSEFMTELGIGSFLGIPNIVIFAFSVGIIMVYVTNNTVFGRWIRGIGCAERMIRLSAVPVDKVKFFIFVLSGGLAALAGAVQAARIGSGVPTTGSGQELDVIAAVVIGGASMTGGVGHCLGTIVGVYIMTILGTGLDLMGVNAYQQMVIKGIVLALAVLLSVDRKRIVIMK
jgi:ribose/xylose/arabinose/galactoside ABC-type transport system permease subunit